MNSTITLFEPTQAHSAIQALWRTLKPFVMDGQRLQLSVKPERKSRPQENLYHKQIDTIAAQCAHSAQQYDAEDWKRLLIQAFYAETKDDPNLADEWKALGGYRIVPSLDGSSLVVLGAQSRKFSKKLASAFVEWLYAWGAMNGVIFKEPQ